MTTVYIKPMVWSGYTNYYVGLRPSDPAAGPGDRLGSYFFATASLKTAVAYAEHEAEHLNADVVVCPSVVGY